MKAKIYYKIALASILEETEYKTKETKSRLRVRLDNIWGTANDAITAFSEVSEQEEKDRRKPENCRYRKEDGCYWMGEPNLCVGPDDYCCPGFSRIPTASTPEEPHR